MANIRKMTSKELTNKIIANRVILGRTTDINLKRKLIADNRKMMIELDRREGR